MPEHYQVAGLLGWADLGSLARALKDYGLYGLVALVAVIWQVVHARVPKAGSEEVRRHYRRLEVYALAFLAIIVAAAGTLAIIQHLPDRWVRGSFADLKEDFPTEKGIVNHEVRLLANKHFTQRVRGAMGEYRLDWIAQPSERLTVRFREMRRVLTDVAVDKDPSKSDPSARTKKEVVHAADYEADIPLDVDEVTYYYTGPNQALPDGGFVAQSAAHVALKKLASVPVQRPAARGAWLSILLGQAFAQASTLSGAGAAGQDMGGELARIVAYLGQLDFDKQQYGLELLSNKGAQALGSVDQILAKLGEPRAGNLPDGSRPELIAHNVRLFLEGGGNPEARTPERLASLAYAYYWADDYETACELFKKVGNAGDSGQVAMSWRKWYAWGIALRQLGRSDEAPAKLEEAFKAADDPCDRANVRASLAYTLGQIRAATPEAAEALTAQKVQYYEEALVLCPQHARANNNLAWTLASRGLAGDDARALELVERAIARRPDDPDYLDTKGTILCKLGRKDEGVQALERAVSHQTKLMPKFQARLKACAGGTPLPL